MIVCDWLTYLIMERRSVVGMVRLDNDRSTMSVLLSSGLFKVLERVYYLFSCVLSLLIVYPLDLGLKLRLLTRFSKSLFNSSNTPLQIKFVSVTVKSVH